MENLLHNFGIQLQNEFSGIQNIQWEIIAVADIASQTIHSYRCSFSTAVHVILISDQEIAPLRKAVNQAEVTDITKVHKFGNWDPAYGMTGIGIIYLPKEYYYDGGVRKGKPHGHGRIAWTNQDIYHGDVSEGKASGQGKYQSSRKAIKYQGQWVDGHPSDGILNYNGTKSEVHFRKNRQLTIVLKDGTVYSGDIARRSNEYIIEGNGKMTFTDGSYYQGHWKDGHMHGRGQFVWKTGQKYKGDYHIGKKEGFGTYFYNKTKYYEGMWEDGRQHGDGALYEKGTKIFTGRWFDGSPDGLHNNDY